MSKRVWLFGLIILVLLSAAAVTMIHAESLGLAVTLDGRALDPEIRVIDKDGSQYINLPFLGKYLHIASDWDPDNGEICLRFGSLSIVMFENTVEYTTNGEPRRLKTAPFQRDGQLWLPLEFIGRLGVSAVSQNAQSFNLSWNDNYLLGMEVVKYQDRPAFVLIGAKPLKVKSFLLTNPDRLVVDLDGVVPHPAFDGSLADNPLVKKVRYSKTEDGLRVVFDLNQLNGYRIIQEPNFNRLTIVMNYRVDEVSFFNKDQERKVYIRSTFPAKYRVATYDRPNRLVIDLDGATLAGNSNPIAGDGQWVKSVRMSQFDPNTVRVVLDLVETAPCFVTRSQNNPNLIEVRTMQQITALAWSEANGSGQLTIDGDGELVNTIRKQKNPQRLEVDFNFAKVGGGLTVPAIKSEQVRSVKIYNLNATTVRMEIALNYFVGVNTQSSADRRRLVISFKRSPIIGKTVVLDPGHGGVDPGASGRQGTLEKEVNLDVSLRLKNLLEEAGAHVVMTRMDDTFISLYERPFLANYIFADLFVSVHTNNHQNYQVQGVEVYYYQSRADSKALAKNVLDELIRNTQFNNLGVKYNDFVVIREAQMPGILVEMGFLSNFQEETTIRTPEFREKAATGIFQGIMDFYQN